MILSSDSLGNFGAVGYFASARTTQSALIAFIDMKSKLARRQGNQENLNGPRLSKKNRAGLNWRGQRD
jgi:hypothetical protein